jgi:hypothetical protein
LRQFRKALRAAKIINNSAPSADEPTWMLQCRRTAVEMLAHNRNMHALNGNISPGAMENVASTTDRASESTILGEWTSARLPELAGAAVVLTEFLLGAKIGENGNPVSAGQFPMQMLDSRIRRWA